MLQSLSSRKLSSFTKAWTEECARRETLMESIESTEHRLCDVIIEVRADDSDEMTVQLGSSISHLCAVSDYFDTLLSVDSSVKQSVIKVPRLRESEMRALNAVAFCCLDKLEISVNNLASLMNTADYCSIHYLKEACEECMEELFARGTLEEQLRVIADLDHFGLSQAAHNLFERMDCSELLLSTTALTYDSDLIIKILKSPSLGLDEESIFLRCIQWARYQTSSKVDKDRIMREERMLEEEEKEEGRRKSEAASAAAEVGEEGGGTLSETTTSKKKETMVEVKKESDQDVTAEISFSTDTTIVEISKEKEEGRRLESAAVEPIVEVSAVVVASESGASTSSSSSSSLSSLKKVSEEEEKKGTEEDGSTMIEEEKEASGLLSSDVLELMQRLKPFIRFPLMSEEFRCTKVLPSGLLSEQEFIQVCCMPFGVIFKDGLYQFCQSDPRKGRSLRHEWDVRTIDGNFYRIDHSEGLLTRIKGGGDMMASLTGPIFSGRDSVEFEIVNGNGGNSYAMFGVLECSEERRKGKFGQPLRGVGFHSNGPSWYYPKSTESGFGQKCVVGDKVKVEVYISTDRSNGTITFYKNGEAMAEPKALEHHLNLTQGLLFACRPHRKNEAIKIIRPHKMDFSGVFGTFSK